MVLTHFGPFGHQFGSLVTCWTLHEASRCLVAYGGCFGHLAVLGGFGVKNHPKKKFRNVFGDTLGGGYQQCFRMVLGPLNPNSGPWSPV